MLTDLGKVGAVLARPIVQMQQYGAGLQTVLHMWTGDVEVTIVHHPSPSPPKASQIPRGLAIAAALVSSGVDFIFAAGGETAAEHWARLQFREPAASVPRWTRRAFLAAAPGIHSSIIKVVAPAPIHCRASKRRKEGLFSLWRQGLIGLSPPNPVSSTIRVEIEERMHMILNALRQENCKLEGCWSIHDKCSAGSCHLSSCNNP